MDESCSIQATSSNYIKKGRSKITWGWGTAMRNLGVPFSYFFRKLGVPSKNKNLSCYYLFAKKENN